MFFQEAQLDQLYRFVSVQIHIPSLYSFPLWSETEQTLVPPWLDYATSEYLEDKISVSLGAAAGYLFFKIRGLKRKRNQSQSQKEATSI